MKRSGQWDGGQRSSDNSGGRNRESIFFCVCCCEVLAPVQHGPRTQCCSSDEESSAAPLSLLHPVPTASLSHFSSLHAPRSPSLPRLCPANVIHVLCSGGDLLRLQKEGIFTDQSDGVELCSCCTLAVPSSITAATTATHTHTAVFAGANASGREHVWAHRTHILKEAGSVEYFAWSPVLILEAMGYWFY